jgi:hypothetical protein
MENAQVAGDTGLMDPGLLDDVTDLSLTVLQRLDDAAASGVCESLESVHMHGNVYILLCI